MALTEHNDGEYQGGKGGGEEDGKGVRHRNHRHREEGQG